MRGALVGLSVSVFTAVVAGAAWLASAALGCTGTVDFGDDDTAPCRVASFSSQYQTAIVSENGSDIALFGENGVAQAAFNLGPLEIASNVFIESDGTARFTEGWVVMETGEVVGFEAVGSLRLVCGGDELRGYDFEWGPTTVVRSTFDDRGEAVGVLAGLRLGTVAVTSGVDSAVVLRDEDVSVGRVTSLDVAGPGPMTDGLVFVER